MKKSLGLLLVFLAAALVAFAQSGNSQKESEQTKPPMMICPMMGTTSDIPMSQMMQGMPQRMAGMFALSSEEVAKVLQDKKASLGLSDVQVKSIADLIASSQQQKAGEKMQSMMKQMQAGMQAGMKCPCMQSSSK